MGRLVIILLELGSVTETHYSSVSKRPVTGYGAQESIATSRPSIAIPTIPSALILRNGCEGVPFSQPNVEASLVSIFPFILSSLLLNQLVW